jgi:hypothetical protein
MQFTWPEGLEHPIPRSQAKAEKSDFLHGPATWHALDRNLRKRRRRAR